MTITTRGPQPNRTVSALLSLLTNAGVQLPDDGPFWAISTAS